MKDGHCPMCQSTEIYTSDEITFRASGQIVRLETMEFKPYVCINCGFASLYADDTDELAKLTKAKEWKKVS